MSDDKILHEDEVREVIDDEVTKDFFKRTVYTLGPAAGDYDIEWLDAENATPWNVTLTLVEGVVYLNGDLNFSGANDILNGGTLPDELLPITNVNFIVSGWDNSLVGDARNVLARVSVGADGSFAVQFADGTDFAADDEVYLSGSYLVALA